MRSVLRARPGHMCPDCGGLLWDPEAGEVRGGVDVDIVRTFAIPLQCADCARWIDTSTTRVLCCRTGRVDYHLSAAS